MREHFSGDPEETLIKKSYYVARNLNQGPSEYELIRLMPNELLNMSVLGLVARVCFSLHIYL